MRNGYTSSDDARLARLNGLLAAREGAERDALLARLRIGVHAGVEVCTFTALPNRSQRATPCRWNVTSAAAGAKVPWGPKRFNLLPPDRRQRVSQAFCSALACGYSQV